MPPGANPCAGGVHPEDIKGSNSRREDRAQRARRNRKPRTHNHAQKRAELTHRKWQAAMDGLA